MEYERYYSSFLLILSEVKFVLILEKDSFSFIIEFFDNTLLKFSESWITFFSNEIKDRVNEKLSYKIGAKLMKPIFDDLKTKYDYEEHGGTPLLGVNGISIVCHGSSGPRSIMNSIFLGQKCIQNNLIEDTQKSLAIHFGD